MAYECELTDGTTTIDLYYNATGWSLLDEGFKPGLPEQISTYGGLAGTILARQYDGRRAIPLMLFLEGSSDDDLISRLNNLILLLRQAQNYHLDGFGSAVYLEFKLSGATNTTRFRVLRGSVDIDRIMSMFCKSEFVIDQVPVFVECEPYWEATTDVDLENLLDNPGFEEWHGGTADSQPDGWSDVESLTAGTGTNNRESTAIKQGRYALRIDVSGINSGNIKGVYQAIQTRLVASTQYNLSIWVKNAAITNGVVQIWVEGNISGIFGYALNSGMVNAGWTKYNISFTPAAGDIAGWVRVYCCLVATSNGCSGTVYLDRMMVITGSAAPVAWISSSYLYNHYDGDAGHINYIDVEDIPGEVDAFANTLMKVIALGGANNVAGLRMGRRYRSTATAFQEIFNAVDGTVGTDTTLGADADYPGGQRATCTFASVATDARRLYWTLNAANLPYNAGKFRVLLLMATSANGLVNVYIKTATGGIEACAGPIKVTGNLGAVVTLTAFDMGVILIPPAALPESENYDRTVTLEVWAARTSGGMSLYIGSIFLMPVEEGYGATQSPDTASADLITTNEHCFIEGIKQPARAYKLTTTPLVYRMWPLVQSGIDVLKPNIPQRLFFLVTHDPTLTPYDLDATMKVTLSYRARGVTLRGLT